MARAAGVRASSTILLLLMMLTVITFAEEEIQSSSVNGDGVEDGAASSNRKLQQALSDSVRGCNNVLGWMHKVFSNSNSNTVATMSKHDRAATQDCLENLQDSLDQLRQSQAELQQLRSTTFRLQISDVQTYMSAALTNLDSCLYGFQEVPPSPYSSSSTKKLLATVQGRIKTLESVVSNALALVNACAASNGASC